MPTENPRITITVDDDLLNKITEYKFEKRLKNQTQAVVSLIEEGMGKSDDTPSDNYGIKNYHDLDDHGKEVVSLVIAAEFKRMEQAKETKLSDKEDMVRLTYYNEIGAAAGNGMPLYEDREYSIVIEVPDNKLTRRADFAIRVAGDSMEPEYSNDDIVLVKKQTVDVGDVGIFIINGDSYIKKLGNSELISLNPKFDNVGLHEFDKIAIVGKVIGKL